MHRIPIYKAEKDVGLQDKLLATSALAYAVPIKVGHADDFLPPAMKEHLLALAAQLGQVDLFYLDSLLASIGWNLNDDVFDRIEVWKARATPEDKPFNL